MSSHRGRQVRTNGVTEYSNKNKKGILTRMDHLKDIRLKEDFYKGPSVLILSLFTPHLITVSTFITEDGKICSHHLPVTTMNINK